MTGRRATRDSSPHEPADWDHGSHCGRSWIRSPFGDNGLSAKRKPDTMNIWTFLYIYLAGAVLVALRMGWHIRYRLDKYDRRFSDVRGTFWFDVILWPMLLLKPDTLIHPAFPANIWNEGRADAERELDRLAQNLPSCGSSIRYVPKEDESGDCDSEFVFDAAAVDTIMAKRLAELPAAQHGRYPAILNWLRQRDPANAAPTDVPAAWNGHFRNVAVGMMNRGLGQVKCGKCSDIIPQEQISIDSGPTGMPMSGWVYNLWCCPRGHKLLTKDAIHFFIRKSD